MPPPAILPPRSSVVNDAVSATIPAATVVNAYYIGAALCLFSLLSACVAVGVDATYSGGGGERGTNCDVGELGICDLSEEDVLSEDRCACASGGNNCKGAARCSDGAAVAATASYVAAGSRSGGGTAVSYSSTSSVRTSQTFWLGLFGGGPSSRLAVVSVPGCDPDAAYSPAEGFSDPRSLQFELELPLMTSRRDTTAADCIERPGDSGVSWHRDAVTRGGTSSSPPASSVPLGDCRGSSSCSGSSVGVLSSPSSPAPHPFLHRCDLHRFNKREAFEAASVDNEVDLSLPSTMHSPPLAGDGDGGGSCSGSGASYFPHHTGSNYPRNCGGYRGGASLGSTSTSAGTTLSHASSLCMDTTASAAAAAPSCVVIIPTSSTPSASSAAAATTAIRAPFLHLHPLLHRLATDVASLPPAYWVLCPIALLAFPTVTSFNAVAGALLRGRWEASGEAASPMRVNSTLGIMYTTAAALSLVVGGVVDRCGRRAVFMSAALAVVCAVHFTLALPPPSAAPSSSSGVPPSSVLIPPVEALMAALGVCFALFGAAFWTAIAYAAPPPALGTAYGLMGSIQNIGLAVAPAVIGMLQPPACGDAFLCVEGLLAGLAVVGAIVAAVAAVMEGRARRAPQQQQQQQH